MIQSREIEPEGSRGSRLCSSQLFRSAIGSGWRVLPATPPTPPDKRFSRIRRLESGGSIRSQVRSRSGGDQIGSTLPDVSSVSGSSFFPAGLKCSTRGPASALFGLLELPGYQRSLATPRFPSVLRLPGPPRGMPSRLLRPLLTPRSEPWPVRGLRGWSLRGTAASVLPALVESTWFSSV
jgi:hypothetical protein